MDEFDRTLGLVERLIEKTAAGQVEWEKVSSPFNFWTTFDHGHVGITSRDKDDFHPIIFRVDNLSGDTVAELTTRNPETSPGWVAEEWELLVLELYAAARRFALGVDTVLSGILGDLGD